MAVLFGMKPWCVRSEETEIEQRASEISAVGYIAQLTDLPNRRLRKRRFPFGFQAPPPQDSDNQSVKPNPPMTGQRVRKRKDTDG